jgi:hypothetical protein
VSEPSRQQRALDAVAEEFSATWEGDGSPDASLRIGGRRIAVEIASITSRSRGDHIKPRLRFDRVALRLVSEVAAALDDPARGKTVIWTITAPIWQPANTRAAIVETVVEGLASRSTTVDAAAKMFDNEVKLRILDTSLRPGATTAGFVHNPTPGAADVLLDAAQALLEAIGSTAGRQFPRASRGERWLVLVHSDDRSDPATYRQVYSQLLPPGEYERVLMVAGGRIASLTD